MAARVNLLFGNWSEALRAAEKNLEWDKKHVGAMRIKAEALFNLCQFEHAMVLFYRGEVSQV